MDTLQNHDSAINLDLFKRCRFYHMFDPNANKIFGWNVYRFTLVIIVLIVHLLITFGNLGLFLETDYFLSMVDLFLVAYGNIHVCLSLWKISILLYNASTIWELFDVTRIHFFKSKHCIRNVKILFNHQKKTVKLTELYYFFGKMLIIQWIVFPFIVNTFTTPESANQRILNIINFPFPVNTHTYNQYYVIFYVVETILAIYVMYCILMIDIIMLSFGWVIVAQYEVLIQAYSEVGFNTQIKNSFKFRDDYGDFKAIIIDQLKICLKLKLFSSIVRPIILMYVAVTSSLIVILTYAFILICLSPESYSILGIFKVGSTVLFLCFQLFLYCYLFDTMNLKSESVNFGIYSCDWTKMDCKFKKLLLLATQMNNANQLMLKASPKKVINLQFFANVMMTCYNIVSVLVKTMRIKNSPSE